MRARRAALWFRLLVDAVPQAQQHAAGRAVRCGMAQRCEGWVQPARLYAVRDAAVLRYAVPDEVVQQYAVAEKVVPQCAEQDEAVLRNGVPAEPPFGAEAQLFLEAVQVRDVEELRAAVVRAVRVF